MNDQDGQRKRRTLLTLVAIAIVSWTVALGAIPRAPARIVTHWGLNGQPNGFMDRVPGLLVMPALLTGLILLFQVLPMIDPIGQNYAAFAKTYRLIQVLVAGFLVAVQIVTTVAAVGMLSVNVPFWISLLVAVMLIGLGNVLGKLRPNWFAGIRTPWTLSSPEVWTRTHRLGGRLLVLVGVMILLTDIALPAQFAIVVLVGGILLWAAATALYSYWVWHRLSPQ